MSERPIPADIEAEEAVIAVGMLPEGAEQLADLAVILAPTDFYREHNGWVWGAILDLFHRGEVPNQITVANRLVALNRLEDVGGQTFLADVIRRLTTPFGAEWYAHLVKECSRRRQIYASAWAIQEDAVKGEDTADAIIERGQDAFVRLGAQRARALTYSMRDIVSGATDEKSLVELMQAQMEKPEEIAGYAFGWPELETILGGLIPTHLLVAMADTSVGKSYFAHFIAWQIAKTGISVWLVSTEMSHNEIGLRMAWMEADMNPRKFRTSPASEQDRRMAARAQAILADLPISIMDVGKPSLPTLRAEARRMAAHGAQVMILDHMQHVRAPGMRGAEAVSEVASDLKDIAMQLRWPVLAISHINRDSARNGIDIHSGKGSSSIEQDANDVLILEPVSRGADGWELMGEAEAETFRHRYGYVPIRVKTPKVREGTLGWDVRCLDWRRGGRFVDWMEAMGA